MPIGIIKGSHPKPGTGMVGGPMGIPIIPTFGGIIGAHPMGFITGIAWFIVGSGWFIGGGPKPCCGCDLISARILAKPPGGKQPPFGVGRPLDPGAAWSCGRCPSLALPGVRTGSAGSGRCPAAASHSGTGTRSAIARPPVFGGSATNAECEVKAKLPKLTGRGRSNYFKQASQR